MTGPLTSTLDKTFSRTILRLVTMAHDYTIDLERGNPILKAQSHYNDIESEKQSYPQSPIFATAPPCNHTIWLMIAKLIYFFIFFGLGYLLGCSIVRGFGDLAQMISARDRIVGGEFGEWVFSQLDQFV